jgi:preprotein translocase subunit SecF
MFIIKHRKFFVALSVVLVIGSLVLFFTKGLSYGIEFTGGAITEVTYSERPENQAIIEAVSSVVDGEIIVQPFGENGAVIRTRDLLEEERVLMISTLESLAPETEGEAISSFTVERFNSIGPSIGQELRKKALYAMIVVLLAIILFVAYAFRKVSEPVSSWKYGGVAVLALVHDILIPVGIFVLLGLEAGSLFVVGLLSIVGLSVNDTIVVFDRIRENLRINQTETIHEKFGKTVGKSITQTISRSLNTSFTLLVVLVLLYFVGPESTQSLALIMIAGTIIGTYSSVFLASPLLVMLAGKEK